MALDTPETEDLLRRAGHQDGSAIGRILEQHRQKLRRLVAARLNGPMVARLDPSDIVQEALVDAGRKLPAYIRERPLPYYPWLCRLALERLNWFRRFHLGASKRAVGREEHRSSTTQVDRLIASGTSPSAHVIREEERARTSATLDQLTVTDRRVLELRYFAGLSFGEIAAELGIGLGAVKMRHLRALERFRGVWTSDEIDSGSVG